MVLVPETDSDNNFIRLVAVGAFNAIYETRPKPINSEAISSKFTDL